MKTKILNTLKTSIVTVILLAMFQALFVHSLLAQSFNSGPVVLDTPPAGSLFIVSVNNFNDQVTPGVSSIPGVTLIGENAATERENLIRIDNGLYHKAEAGVTNTFDLVIQHQDLLQLVVSAVHIKNYGTNDEESTNIYTNDIPSIGFAFTTFSIAFTPDVGSVGDILEVEFFVPGFGTQYIHFPIVVEGIVDKEAPILGSFVVPQVPKLVLHDPPGDNSYSYFVSDTTYCNTFSNTIGGASTSGVDGTVQLGFSGSLDVGAIVVGAGVNIETTVAVTGSYEMEWTNLDETTYELCISSGSHQGTSADPAHVGPDADVFIGYGASHHYGIFNTIVLDGTDFICETGLVTLIDDNSITEFAFTAADIKADIDNQTLIFNNPNNSVFERELAYNQIRAWQDVLDRNTRNLENGVYNTPQSWTSSAGGGGKEYEISTTNSSATTVATSSTKGLAVELTYLIGGNGVYGGPSFTWNENKSSTVSTSTNVTTIVGYVLDDNAGDDLFIMVIADDPDYGTPMFKLGPGSKTSCPYEGGERLDRPNMYVDEGAKNCNVVYRDNIPNNNLLTIQVEVCNDHPTNSGEYHATLQGNNVTNAAVSFGSQNINNVQFINLNTTIPGNTCIPVTLQIAKNPAFSEYDLTLIVYPSCFSTPYDLGKIEEEGTQLRVLATFGGSGNYPSDADCDGISNVDDACPNTASLNDDDCDGIPNNEDPCPLLPGAPDSDNDFLVDCIDACPNSTNAALNFDRSDVTSPDPQADHVIVSHDPELNLSLDDFTISAWVKPSDEWYKTIVSKGNGFSATTPYIFYIWPTDTYNVPFNHGKLGLYIGGEWVFGTSKILIDTWTHVAVAYEKSTNSVRFYVNGELDAIRYYTNDYTFVDTGDMFIGRQGISANYSGFKGSMDELSLWKKMLNQDAIKRVMEHSLAGTEDRLVAYYKFNDKDPCVAQGGNPVSISDSGPNGFDGTLQNFELGNVGNTPCESNFSPSVNRDSNQDGVGDDCTLSGLELDTDQDGIPDVTDLCPTTSNTAMDFDGINDLVFVQNDGSLNIFGGGQFSMSYWIKMNNDSSKPNPLFYKSNNSGTIVFQILGSNNGPSPNPSGDQYHRRLGIQIDNTWYISRSKIPAGVWTNVAVTASNNKISFYINGEIDNSLSADFSSFVNPNTWASIGENYTTLNYFGGQMDDISIWEKELSEAEIQAIMSSNLTGNETDLKLYFDFNNEVACGQNFVRATVFNLTGNQNGSLLFFNQQGTCHSNWCAGRNTDSNQDGIGDSCNQNLYTCAISTIDSDGDSFPDCLDLCPNESSGSLDFFSVINTVVAVPHQSDLNLLDGDFTLSAWIKKSDIEGAGNFVSPILEKDNFGYSFRINSNKFEILPRNRGRLSVNISGQSFHGKQIIPSNKWVHVAVVFDRNFLPGNIHQVTFYVNGQVDGNSQYLDPTIPLFNGSTEDLIIGFSNFDVFDGQMDEIQIWRKALNSDELITSITQAPNILDSTLEAYYKFDNGIINGSNIQNFTLVDYSNNANNGQLVNFLLSGVRGNWTAGRNSDFDGNGVGDECDQGEECVINYAGIRALSTIVTFDADYETNGVIESTQVIDDPNMVDYDSATEINLNPGFEVKQNAEFHGFIDGCPGNN